MEKYDRFGRDTYTLCQDFVRGTEDLNISWHLLHYIAFDILSPLSLIPVDCKSLHSLIEEGEERDNQHVSLPDHPNNIPNPVTNSPHFTTSPSSSTAISPSSPSSSNNIMIMEERYLSLIEALPNDQPFIIVSHQVLVQSVKHLQETLQTIMQSMGEE
eukprot:Phypoly_transcript_09237.p1 GENE.Phypoly_transcript_09237~~Phypoly_transcript_09237.p1  ORF type:complete len:158 (+),score=23.64 Phypoly_transcript_09237:488-961(+)